MAGDADYESYARVAVAAAREAGAVILAAFSGAKAVQLKGAVDLVTETDQQCEALVLAALRSHFPDHAFIGEETSAAEGATPALTDAPTWLVDPLDGTTNFVHRFPFVCVSIALAVRREVVVGCVYNPILQELFTAVKGRGAQLNGEPCRVSDCSQLQNALVATEIGTSREPATVAAIFDRVSAVTAATRSLRCSGSCALNLCGVACGRLDGFYEIGFGGPWDCAAGALILREAGGRVIDPAGGPFSLMARRVLGATPDLAPQLAGLLAGRLAPAEPQVPS